MSQPWNLVKERKAVARDTIEGFLVRGLPLVAKISRKLCESMGPA